MSMLMVPRIATAMKYLTLWMDSQFTLKKTFYGL